MSPQKKKKSGNAHHIHDSIMDLLSKVKPSLQSYMNGAGPDSVSHDMQKVASLAETFSENRTKANQGLTHLVDALDQEGVNLWNMTGLVGKCEGEEARTPISTVRYAAFRLIEAGFQTKPGLEALLHIVQVASKTGLSLSEAGNHVGAGRVLTCAAKFEEMLARESASDDSQKRRVAFATVMYLCSRMELAWNEKNHTLAEFMSKKITNDVQRLALLTTHVRKHLALKFQNIGRSLLNDNVKQAPEAIEWLQRAFSILDKLAEDESGPTNPELKISMLRTLARAYFITESYDRAEATLDELIPAVETSGNNSSPEYQELRWLRLTVLKRRKASEPALLNAFESIINHVVWSEGNVADILQELRTINTPATLVAEVHRICLRRAVQQKDGEPDHADRLAFSIIFHCAKDESHTRAMKTLEDFFTLLSETGIEFSRVSVTACLSLLWQTGGRYHKSKKWSLAADWFLVGGNPFFKKNSPSSTSKCFRKAALCYLEQREYAKASTIIRRCPMGEATTQYIIFLACFHQGLEDDAIRAIKDMQTAPDFDRKMLLLATQISHSSGLKRVLLAVLDGLLKTLKLGSNGETVVEAMALLRCIIKLILGLLVDPLANRNALIDTLVSHFRTAKILALAALEQKAVALIQKDISWLWRKAYNCAVQGCSEWEGCGEQISELFDMSRILLDVCWKSSPLDIDVESCDYLINSIFAAVAGRVFSAREVMNTTGMADVSQFHKMIEEIRKSISAIKDVLSKKKSSSNKDDHGEQLLHILRIFEMEFLIQVKGWDKVSEIIKEVVKSERMAAVTYEAFADLLWVAADCPTDVLQGCLEAILNASLENRSLSVERFSRWLRAICTIVLARDSPDDKTKAFGYFEQSVTVMQQYENAANEAYPMDERQWLLATAYNTATDCLHASLVDEARRWFEISISVCRFVPGGKERAEKISDTYTHLLSRYRLE